MAILGSLNTEHGITVIMVTHDSAVAHKCQRIVHIRDGEIESEEKI